MKKLIWDEWSKNHINKHNVTVNEAEEIYKNWKLENDSYLGRKEYFGITNKGRMLVIIVSIYRN